MLKTSEQNGVTEIKNTAKGSQDQRLLRAGSECRVPVGRGGCRIWLPGRDCVSTCKKPLTPPLILWSKYHSRRTGPSADGGGGHIHPPAQSCQVTVAPERKATREGHSPARCP